MAFAIAPIVGALARSLSMVVVAITNGIGVERSFQAVVPFVIGALLVGYVLTVVILAPAYFLMMRKRSRLGLFAIVTVAFVLTFFFVFVYAWGIFEPNAYTVSPGGQTVHVSASFSAMLGGLRAGLDAGVWSAVGGLAFWSIQYKSNNRGQTTIE